MMFAAQLIWIYLYPLALAFIPQWLSLLWEFLIIMLSQFSLTFPLAQWWMLFFITQLLIIPVLIGMVFPVSCVIVGYI